SWDAAQFEVPAHRFADLSQADRGVALLTRDKHGFDVRGSTLRLTLLRSPTAPDPQADRGAHDVDYALLPHAGGLAAARIPQHAEAYELPLRAVATTPHPGDLPPAGTLLDLRAEGCVAVTAVKRAERGDAVVVRLCEVGGGDAEVELPPATRCDLLERPHGGAAEQTRTALGPFELATLRLAAQPGETRGAAPPRVPPRRAPLSRAGQET